MAWLLAIPPAVLRALRRAGSQDLQRLAASIAFYALFSLPAFLVAAISLAGQVYGERETRVQLVAQVSRYLGAKPATTVESVLEAAVAAGANGALPRIFAFVALILGSTLMFVELQHALNRIWGATPTRRWFVALALKRAVSFGMVLIAAAVLLMSMAVSVAITRFGAWLTDLLPRDLALGLIRWIEPAVALTALAALFLLLFKVLPDGRVPWKRAWVGAVATAVLLVATKSIMGQYLGVADPGSVYGAAGSLVVLLVWIYASAVVILFGGTFAVAWEETRTVRPEPPGAAGPIPAQRS